MGAAPPPGARQNVVPSLNILKVPLFGTPCMFFNGKCVFPPIPSHLEYKSIYSYFTSKTLNVKVEENMRGWAHVPSRIGPANS